MIKDVKSYFQTVASRLSNAFTVEEFDTERELEFWSLAAEHISRKETPNFIDIVNWIDILYGAPVHFIYKKKDKDKLQLYRRQVLVENIKRVTSNDGGELSKKQRQQVREYEEQLEHIDSRIPWNEEYLNTGISSHSIGKCEHLPIYKDDTFWGIYCVGPYIRSPEKIRAKLHIVARMLSKWLVELESKQKKEAKGYGAKAEKVASDLGTGTLNIDRIANLMLGYLADRKSAAFGGVLELSNNELEFLAQHKLEEETVSWIINNISPNDETPELHKKFNLLLETSQVDEGDKVLLSELKAGNTRAVMFLGISNSESEEQQVENKISNTLKELLVYRRQNSEISDQLINTYYAMLRELEKARERTYYHTPRMIALVEGFGQMFGMDEDELEQLLLTAKLHDVGYIVTRQLDDRMTMGAELEHPFIGGMIVDALPVAKDVKEGIKTHHEWINGSGTPQGLSGEEISWTGKIIGLFEFVTEFIETNEHDNSKSGDEWIEKLSSELIERAEDQFDMVLVPTAVEMVSMLGWEKCCTIGTEENRS